MSISSRNLFISPPLFSHRVPCSSLRISRVFPWRGVLVHSRPRREATASLYHHSYESYDASNGKGNSNKSHKWKEEQQKKNSKHGLETKEEQGKQSMESEFIEEYKHGEWVLQPDLTVKRRVYFDSQNLSKFKAEEEEEEDATVYYNYNTLHDAITEGNLNIILSFFECSPEGAHTKITDRKETVLHIAIAVVKNNPTFIEELLEHVSQAALFSVNKEGETPLHYAAAHGNLEAAKLLVRRYQELPNVMDNHFQYPIHHAAKNRNRELVSYLMDITPGLWRLEYGPKAVLLNYLIQSDLCDEAVKLFNLQYDRRPKRCQSFDFTGTSHVPSPLVVLSTMPQLFQSLNSYERMFYSWTQMRDMKHANQTNKYALELLKCFCLEISQVKSKEALETVSKAALSAAELGIPEVLEQLFSYFPAILAQEETLLHIFHRAIQNRHSDVFNLLFQLNHRKKLSEQVLDEHGNNILHLTAKLPSQNQLNHSCSALIMQRELQWYKAVESIMPPYTSSLKNKEKITPAAVFTEEHRDMLQQAKDSMISMAHSGTTIATLFTSMAFGAASGVPGGSNSSGYPIFSDTMVFAVFAVSDAISLSLSIAATMMFFSFFTARYDEEDFFRSLPRRLTIGIVTLFCSTISMMVTFGSVFFIILARQKKPCVAGPVIVSSLVPILIFAFYRFPALVERIKCTFGPGVLHQS